MPIVKCTACGQMGFAVGEFDKAGRLVRSFEQKSCSKCGKRRLKRAVFGVDYGWKEDGERYGVPGGAA
jgi:hypothetical protein